MNRETSMKLLENGLRHLYDAEYQTLENLKLMSDKASLKHLKDALNKHHGETQHQLQRLEKVFELLNLEYKPKENPHGVQGMIEKGKEMVKDFVGTTEKSKGMKGIIEEGQELLRQFTDSEAIDAAITSSAQKVEHFEIACYNTLCLLTDKLGLKEVTDLLRESLNEEMKTEKVLKEIADHELNIAA